MFIQSCTRRATIAARQHINTPASKSCMVVSNKLKPRSPLLFSPVFTPTSRHQIVGESQQRSYWWMPKPLQQQSTPAAETDLLVNTDVSAATDVAMITTVGASSTSQSDTSTAIPSSVSAHASASVAGAVESTTALSHHTLHSATEQQRQPMTQSHMDATSQVERPEFVYPLTFGEPHDIILGGHVPESAPHINLIENMLEMLSSTGLPWWGAISALTIMFRLACLPLNISLIRNSARLNAVKVQLEEQGQVMANRTSTEQDKVIAAEMFSQTLKQNRCHPLYNIISPLVMSPMFLSVFLAVERICLHDPGCRGTGGMLWFLDLSSMDPTFMLPVLSAASWLLTIELGAAQPRTEFMRSFRSVMRFAAAVMVPVTAALPSGVFVYWITSNMFSLAQIYVMQQSTVRRFFGIPERTVADKADSSKPVTM